MASDGRTCIERALLKGLAILTACWLSTPAAKADASPLSASITCATGARAMARTELVFGTQRQRRASVPKASWSAFVRGEVTKRFPDGFTIIPCRGQWRGNNGVIILERSHILLVWHDGAGETNVKLEALRDIYRRRFQQQSVMRIDGADCVSF